MKAKTFDRQTAKFLAVVGENMPELSGDVMQGWIENPKSVQKVLREAFCPPEATFKFEIWKTIKLGTGLKTTSDFRHALCTELFWFGGYVNEMIEKLASKVATEKTEVDLVKVTVAELGFKKGARYGQIWERARELGLEPCSPEVGPQLRLQYQDQPNEEMIIVVMTAITVTLPAIFVVERRHPGLWLTSIDISSDSFWDADYRLVFVRPRLRK
jgi:hypothetical protein